MLDGEREVGIKMSTDTSINSSLPGATKSGSNFHRAVMMLSVSLSFFHLMLKSAPMSSPAPL